MPDSQRTGLEPASRRAFFLGAASAGAAVATAAVLPKMVAAPSASNGASALPPRPEKGGGYSLSEHVKRYYKTTSA